MLLSNDGKSYRVRDVGIELGGSVLWLAQEQQAKEQAQPPQQEQGQQRRPGPVVAEEHGLLLGGEPLDGDDRPERLLLDDPHAAVAVVEDGGEVEAAAGQRRIARPGAAGAQRGTLGDPQRHVAFDLLAMLLGHQRAGEPDREAERAALVPRGDRTHRRLRQTHVG